MYETNPGPSVFDSGFLDSECSTETDAPLSKEEKEIKQILENVPGKSVIGFCIRRAIYKSTDGNLRKLIRELKDQQSDAPKELEKVIGSRAMELLAVL